MSKFTAKQERELLELRAQLARLQVAAEQLKRRKEAQQQSTLDLNFSKVVSLADGLPSSGLLWKTLFLPLRWRHRLMAGAVLLAWQWWKKQESSEPTRRIQS